MEGQRHASSTSAALGTAYPPSPPTSQARRRRKKSASRPSSQPIPTARLPRKQTIARRERDAPSRPTFASDEFGMAQRGAAQVSQFYRPGKSTSKKDNGGTVDKLPSRIVATRLARSNASSSSTIGRSPNLGRSDNMPPGQPPSPSPHEPPPVDLSDCAPAERGRNGSRRVKRWLAEQQRMNANIISFDASSSEQIAKAAGTPCNPYLAYPNLAHYASARGNDDDDQASLHSYVIVEEEEEGAEGTAVGRRDHDVAELDRITVPRTSVDTEPDELFFQPPYATPPASSMRGLRPSSISSALPWRNRPFSRTLPNRPASTIGSPSMPPYTPASSQTPPHTPKKNNIPILRRRSPIPDGFRLSVGGSSANDKGEPSTPKSSRFSPRSAQKKVSSSTIVPVPPETPRASTRHRLSSFTQTVASSPDMDPNSPRLSTSASSATTATSTAVENEEQSIASRLRTKLTLRLTKKPSKLSSLGRPSIPPALLPPTSVDSPSRASFSSSTQTIDTPFAPLQSDSSSFLAPPQMLFTKEQTQHHSLSKKDSQSVFREKGNNASSSALSTLSIGSIGSYATSRSNVFAGTTSGRRKRLVVSGIDRDNWDAIEGLQKWCENFGELRQITRMPNGDLHVDFKRSEVADTVCRLSARVFISGVGSVHLSWITGKKR